MALVRIVGAGPAGSSAALAALSAGAEVEIFEKSPFPRHKVCGEFLSPRTAELIADLGVMSRFEDLRPARLKRMRLVFGSREQASNFPGTALGLSRSALDNFLLQEALSRGAALRQQTAANGDVIAIGRTSSAPKGRRLFGFKAHFTGPQNDDMELYFMPRYAYAGVSAIENGGTNVCGLAPESDLAQVNFDIDEYLSRHQPLRDRIGPLKRSMNWMRVGPLVFGNRFSERSPEGYLAGDQLSFVDPFTGSGILAAILSGTLAGRAASERSCPVEHVQRCRSKLLGAFRAASFFRAALEGGWGQQIGAYLPAKVLFQITRPRLW